MNNTMKMNAPTALRMYIIMNPSPPKNILMMNTPKKTTPTTTNRAITKPKIESINVIILSLFLIHR